MKKTMTKLLLIILFVNISNLTFANSTEQKVRVYGEFPMEKLAFFKTIQHDTLIFDHVDSIYNAGWKWGFFIPRSNDIYIRNTYYNVRVISELNNSTISVQKNYHLATKQSIPSDILNSDWIYWIAFVVICFIHYLFFYRLRRYLFYINRRSSHVSSRHKRRRTRIIVWMFVLFTSFCGYCIHSYFFVFCPIIYFALFQTIPSGKWYHYFVIWNDDEHIGIGG